jgi:hypothetical protein
MAAQCYSNEAMMMDLPDYYKQQYVTGTAASLGQYLNPCPKQKKPMNIKVLAKKMLSPELRTLIKVGVLNDDLSIANKEFVLEFYVQRHLKELAAEAKSHMVELKKERDEE